jgi:ubiquinone/menaquinone biosynthesis C-methylase UbiE
MDRRGPTLRSLVKASSVAHYRCPADGTALRIADAATSTGESIETGSLASAAGRRYPVVRGVPHLVYPDRLSPLEEQTQTEYDRVADGIYDTAVDWQFAAFLENEDAIREGMVDELGTQPADRLLEVGCGTGRDSYRLAQRLGDGGALFMQDLSANMVLACQRSMSARDEKMAFRCALEYSVSNASHLPFADGFFDRVFHFGGLNQFADVPQAMLELTRVTRNGGRVVVGDEGVAPWLRGSEFDAIVTTNNPLFKASVPLTAVPHCAREVSVRWIIANCFYLISFTKGDGPPPLDLDLPHHGWRGGSMRTRYYGQLEGVTPQAKALAREAAAAEGISVHDWLDRLVKDAAARGLKRRA